MRTSLADVTSEVVTREAGAQERGGALVHYGADETDLLANARDKGDVVPVRSTSASPSSTHV